MGQQEIMWGYNAKSTKPSLAGIYWDILHQHALTHVSIKQNDNE